MVRSYFLNIVEITGFYCHGDEVNRCDKKELIKLKLTKIDYFKFILQSQLIYTIKLQILVNT